MERSEGQEVFPKMPPPGDEQLQRFCPKHLNVNKPFNIDKTAAGLFLNT
jgi:hypothetical protein